MAKKFGLNNLAEFRGYVNKADITNIGPNYLVPPSQNVLSTDDGRLGVRNGYEVYGASDTTLEPPIGEFDWLTARGVQIMGRFRDDASNNGTLEINYNGTFYELINSLNDDVFNSTTYWDSTEGQDALLFVCGDSNMYYWSGGLATFASATSNSITLEGSESWAEKGFLQAGTRQVIIEGTTYTYTGGESTTTLTGVTPNPASAGHTVGAVVMQAVRTQANNPASGFKNSLIRTLQNQVYVGDLTRRDVYISAAGDYTDYTFSSPRLVGEGALLTLDETPRGFIEQEESMYIGTYNQWYKVDIVLSDDLQNENIVIKLLKSNPLGGPVNQSAIFKIKNDVIFVSNEPTIDSLGRVEQIDTPQSKPLSDPIKKELQNINTAFCSGKYWRSNFYVAFPGSSKVLVYNIEKGYWEAPQTLPVRLFTVFGGDLYGHSSSVLETYKLFTGWDDNGNAMEARAAFSYQNWGRRDHMKMWTEWWTEGYIASNTDLLQTFNIEYQGSESIREYTIEGDDSDILFTQSFDNSLGKNSLGKQPLGSTTTELDDLAKFRHITTSVPSECYECQVIYSTNTKNARWELLCQGGAIDLSPSDNNHIKK